MEKQIEEENKPKKDKFLLTNPDWLDLPDPIVTNIILEHLEIVDYIRFPSVCKKWQSIQNEHRMRHFPYPPPSPLLFPWLVCRHCLYEGNGSLLCYAPYNKKIYKVPFRGISRSICAYGYGWLLVVSPSKEIHISNPITGVQIKLPSPPDIHEHISYVFCTIHISSSPTDPDCTMLIDDGGGLFFLCRLNDKSGWKFIKYYSGNDEGETVFFHNKIYRVGYSDKSVIIVNTLLPDPIVQTTEMDQSEICASLHVKMFSLVELFEDLVMVINLYDDGDNIKGFDVYKADFSIKKWVRMETIGDGVIFYSLNGLLALQADGVELRKNTIYCAEGYMDYGASWRAYDVSSRCWTDGPSDCTECHSEYGLIWFFPTLDYCLEVAKSEGVCQITSN